MIDLRLGDCLDVMAGLEAESVDSVVTDPPYGLEFMGKKWDKLWDSRPNGGAQNGYLGTDGSRRKKGMGRPGPTYKAGAPAQDWHYRWAVEALRVAKPGAMLCAFGGSRTHHRLMCAIEDAGWEIRDVLMWLYGSGFPKSHSISKAIDRAAGAEREVVGESATRLQLQNADSFAGGWKGKDRTEGGGVPITIPATDAAALWDGYGTALKPAYEPIILAMKPLPGTFAQNALGYGVAGLWVDGCRVASENFEPKDRVGASKIMSERPWNLRQHGEGRPRIVEGNSLGRWPANLLLSHAPGCECVGVRKVKGEGGRNIVAKKQDSSWFGPNIGHRQKYHNPDGTETVEAWNCVPECPVRLLDEQSGERISGGKRGGAEYLNNYSDITSGQAVYGRYNDSPHYCYGDTGGASRFFTRFHYSAKASRSERELGLLGHIPCLKCGELDSVTHEHYNGKGEWVTEKCRRNGHPTVKPLDVCRWLCRLTKTPTGGVVLDPFMGSGRISMAAILEGRDTIGIELERPSFEIAQAAVAWAEEQVLEMVQLSLEKEA